LRKPVAILAIAALVGVPIIAPPISPAASGVATASKYCSSYAESRYGDRNVHTPGGEKCVGVGEYCSHAPGYARAYRSVGLRCNREGYLERS
jgi:hypothetical protein